MSKAESLLKREPMKDMVWLITIAYVHPYEGFVSAFMRFLGFGFGRICSARGNLRISGQGFYLLCFEFVKIGIHADKKRMDGMDGWKKQMRKQGKKNKRGCAYNCEQGKKTLYFKSLFICASGIKRRFFPLFPAHFALLLRLQAR
jgi:hypothetical protein